MKRIACMALCALLVLALAAGASAEDEPRVLIAYFTWAENTVVADEQAALDGALGHYANMGDSRSGVDATSTASVLLPGNVTVMAGHIAQMTGGELFSIRVSEPYPSDYDACLDRAADELDDNARPALVAGVENFEQYDIVFLGMPNWWYSCPMAMLSFVEMHDFSGKTVVPFVAHGTGGISGSVRDMSRALPEDCQVLSPIGVYRPDIPTCGPEVESWLAGLNLPIALDALEMSTPEPAR